MRERHVEWVEHLAGFLERCTELSSGPNPLFWNNLVCSAFIASQGDAKMKAEVRQRVQEILLTQVGDHATVGLRQILEAINE